MRILSTLAFIAVASTNGVRGREPPKDGSGIGTDNLTDDDQEIPRPPTANNEDNN